MQEFLVNNTVTCNLMSLTGYRTLVILSLLLNGPKSNTEINEYFFKNPYIGEKFSNDTLRIYINSLRAIGCKITDANKSGKKYELVAHPFDYDIPKSQLKAISKLYKTIYDKIDLRKFLEIDSFLNKLAKYTTNAETMDFLMSLSFTKNIDKGVINDLLLHCKNKNQIIILYDSPKSGLKEIEIICDKISFKSEKLYLWATNLAHSEYSYFLLDRVSKILSIKIQKDTKSVPAIRVVYELYNHNNYKPEADEIILDKTDEKVIIEINAKNEFSIMQRILYHADKCKIIEPEVFKLELLAKLNSMRQSYE